jgi:hypothetical protein
VRRRPAGLCGARRDHRIDLPQRIIGLAEIDELVGILGAGAGAGGAIEIEGLLERPLRRGANV